jgi:hypothetical protein
MKQLSKASRRGNDQAKNQSPPRATGSFIARMDPVARVHAFIFVVAAWLVCLGYTFATQQIWEDALITLRHGENLLQGHGFTYNAGERVHGFTSPVNVLLLTACHLLTGQTSYVVTLWLYRIITIAAFAASGVFLLTAVHDTPPRWAPATWFLGIVYLFDVKNVAFSINGMETGFMLLFVAWAVYMMSRAAPDQWLMRGLCWAGLMWSRPDGCVYIAALGLAELAFLAESRRDTFVSLLKSGVVCGVVYAPWLIWATAYYGSPVPHTIIAKANVEAGPLAQVVTAADNYLSLIISASAEAFRPIYYGDAMDLWAKGLLARAIGGLTKFVALVGLLYFIYPTRDRFGRAMSLAFAIVCSYFTYMSLVFPWYFPPAMLLGAVAVTRAATMLAFSTPSTVPTAAAPAVSWRKRVVTAALIVLAVGSIGQFAIATRKERYQQALIENGNRALVGVWLRENGQPTDTVYLEPLGYIGYFSGMHMTDYPGLVSPEVVRIRRGLPSDPYSIAMARYLVIPELKPDWVVLRHIELHHFSTLPIFEQFQKDYKPVRQFDVVEKLNSYGDFPGKNNLGFDAGFTVFRRNEAVK